jgi:predicted kinase
MLIGLPASGKDTWIKQFIKNNTEKFNVYSSDDIREELYGDAATQGDSAEVFKIMRERATKSIRRGENTIYNATNIKVKDRRAIMNEINKFKDVMCYAIIIGTTYEQCLKNNAKRANNGGREVPESIINRMYKSFEPPHYFEGFNKIEVVYPFIKPFLNYKDLAKQLKKVPHDNPHHNYSVGSHIAAAAKNCEKDIKKKKFTLGLDDNDEYKSYYDSILPKVLWMHDLGKGKAKTFYNYKGKLDTIAHYYNHENIGAYDYMFYLVGTDEYNPLKPNYDCNIAAAICYHMRPYGWKEEKTKEKYKKLWGFRLYNLVMAVHKYDIENP